MWTIRKLAQYVDEAYCHGHFPPLRALITRHKIFAYYGFLGDDNFGDELVFEAAKQLLEPNVLLLIKRRMPFHLAAWSRICKRRFDGVVIGGGTLLSKTFYERSFYLHLIRMGKPIFMLGTGAIRRDTWDSGWCELMEHRVWGGVRGPLSVLHAAEFGEKLSVIGDAAFTLFRREGASDSAVKHNTVLINCGAHYIFDGLAVSRSAVEQFVTEVIGQGFEVKFLPFHSVDLNLGRELAKRHPRVEVLSIPKSYEEAEKHFRSCAFAVGERLHFPVMAMLARCPFFSVNYEEKHEDALASVGLSGAGRAPRDVSAEGIRAAFEARARFDWANVFEQIEQFQKRQREEAREFLGVAAHSSFFAPLF